MEMTSGQLIKPDAQKTYMSKRQEISSFRWGEESEVKEPKNEFYKSMKFWEYGRRFSEWDWKWMEEALRWELKESRLVSLQRHNDDSPLSGLLRIYLWIGGYENPVYIYEHAGDGGDRWLTGGGKLWAHSEGKVAAILE